MSLIYVGIQIKQNTNTLKVSTAHNTAEDFSAPYLSLAEHGDMADIFFRGLQDLEALESVERLRFYGFFTNSSAPMKTRTISSGVLANWGSVGPAR